MERSGARVQLKLKRDKREEENSFLFREKGVVRREVREREKIFTFSLRSTDIGWLSSDGPRFKVGVFGEGYTWIPETLSFIKVSRGRFEESKVSGSGSIRGTSSGRCSCFKR